MNLETRFLSVLADFFLVEPSCDSLAAALTAAICFILYGVRFVEVSGDVPVAKQELNLSSVLDVRVWSRIGSQSDYKMGTDPNTVFGGKCMRRSNPKASRDQRAWLMCQLSAGD